MVSDRVFENAINCLIVRGGNDGCTTTTFCASEALEIKLKSRAGSKFSFISAALVAWPGALSKIV